MRAAVLAIFWMLLSSGVQAQVVDDEVISAVPVAAEVPVADALRISAAAFERVLESCSASSDMVHDRMRVRLQSTLDILKKRCGLNDSQIHRMEFAGRRDITKLTEVTEQLRTQFIDVEQPAKVRALIPQDVYRRVTAPSLKQFDDDTMFRKVARGQLSDAQWEQYLAWEREQQEEGVRNAIAHFFGKGRLTELQEREATRVILQKYPRWQPISSNIPSCEYVAALIAGELEEELKPIFTESQCRHLQGYAFYAKRMEPQLIRVGLWPIPERKSAMP